MNYRKFLTQVLFLAVVTIGTLLACLPPASADGPPSPEVPAVTDPCFRQDPECYFPEVECADNVFVPLNLDGTWTCPPLGEQLPEEVIGRQVDCPDGTVGQIIDIDLNTNCTEVPGEYPVLSDTTLTPTASAPEEVKRVNPFHYGLVAVGLVLIAAGALYGMFRKNPS